MKLAIRTTMQHVALLQKITLDLVDQLDGRLIALAAGERFHKAGPEFDDHDEDSTGNGEEEGVAGSSASR
jgi:hypothetical protein